MRMSVKEKEKIRSSEKRFSIPIKNKDFKTDFNSIKS